MEPDRIYRHFCMMARALEVVGERWSLLIVRDLLLGPRRFTDLVHSLAEITPTRLTSRLRRLEAAGILVRVAPPAGREVWYRLTDAGLALGPTIEALTLWGIDHAREQPRAGEPASPVPVMIGTRTWVSAHGRAPSAATTWVWRFGENDAYALRFDEGVWTLSCGDAEEADLTVEATPEAWARLLTASRDARRLRRSGVRLAGDAGAAAEFARVFALVP